MNAAVTRWFCKKNQRYLTQQELKDHKCRKKPLKNRRGIKSIYCGELQKIEGYKGIGVQGEFY